MMRKDVRIGFAIGSVLLAVLIVYGLVTSGPSNTQVTLAADPETPAGQAHPGEAGSGESSVPPLAGDRAGTSAAGNGALASNGSTNNGATDAGLGASSPETNQMPGGASAPDRWEHALTRGELPPVLMTQAPTPTDASRNGGTSAPAGAAQPGQPLSSDGGAADERAVDNASGAGDAPPPAVPAETSPGVSAASPLSAPPGPSVNSGPSDTGLDARELASMVSVPSTQPLEGSGGLGQRTHVVQPNETFSSIAAVAYGSESYYPHLLRANPSVDPKKLRAGMTIILPPRDQVVPRNGVRSDAPATGGDAPLAPAPIDEKTQYRVEASDSLYKIALKLYGRADKVNALYELNKQTIGPNPSRLKTGIVLQLPEPPTQSPQTAAR